jgi:hypothetical protein
LPLHKADGEHDFDNTYKKAHTEARYAFAARYKGGRNRDMVELAHVKSAS